MGTEYIYKICESCKGTGKKVSPSSFNLPPEEAGTPDCGICKGVGKILWGYLQDELEGEE